MHEGVAGPNRGANLWHQPTPLSRHLQDLAQRDFEVFLNVVAQGLQRRDIEDFGAVAKIASQSLAHQAVDASQKCRQGLARAGGSGNQGGMSGENVRPALLLGLGWSAETANKPLAHQGMGPVQGYG